jgi:hypothetical protein
MASNINDKETNVNSRKIRCLVDKDAFFGLMSKETPNDCAHSIKEQISTEKLIREAYEEFISESAGDPE